MLAKRPWDNIEQILIVISFKWLLARWWMGANLPLCRALERLFNMTIKYLSFRFYCIFLSLSCKLLCPPSSSSFFILYLPPTPLLLSLSLHITSSVQCSFLRRLNWDSAFLHLGALTYVLWHALSQFYVVIDFSSPPPLCITLLLKSTQTILPFALWFFPLLSRGDLKCTAEKNMSDQGWGGCWSLKSVVPSEKNKKGKGTTRRWQVKLGSATYQNFTSIFRIPKIHRHVKTQNLGFWAASSAPHLTG